MKVLLRRFNICKERPVGNGIYHLDKPIIISYPGPGLDKQTNLAPCLLPVYRVHASLQVLNVERGVCGIGKRFHYCIVPQHNKVLPSPPVHGIFQCHPKHGHDSLSLHQLSPRTALLRIKEFLRGSKPIARCAGHFARQVVGHSGCWGQEGFVVVHFVQDGGVDFELFECTAVIVRVAEDGREVKSEEEVHREKEHVSSQEEIVSSPCTGNETHCLYVQCIN
uniref:Uncharacterized protein n=1 Tax=Cacopsylla melanoneura TaxID=428564 RepID=A0A8D8VGI7_9HEMI